MDGNKGNKRRHTLFGGIGSSLWNLVPKFSTETNEVAEKSIPKKDIRARNFYSNVDLDLSDGEDEHRNTRLKRESTNRGMEGEDTESKVKRARLNVSTNRSILQPDQSNADPNKSFSYRSVCTKLDKPTVNNSLINASLSTSIDSLADSTNGFSHGPTASTLSFNIFSQRNTPASNEFTDQGYKRAVTPHLQTQRRFKTVIKRDRLSSYLSREEVTTKESMLSTPKFAVPEVADVYGSKRFDFSQLRKTPLNVKEAPSNKNWNCGNCNTDNPLHFNFCPYCANPNPIHKSAVSKSLIMSACVDGNSWSCARCSTVNNRDNRSCTCCYFSKDASYKKPTFGGHSVPGLAQSLNRIFGEDKATEDKQKVDAQTQNVPLPFKFGAPNQTWSCPSCLVDNSQDKEECACCQTKKPQTNASLLKKPVEIKSFMTGRAKEADFTSGSIFAASDKSTPANPKWQCPTCMVENSADVNECVCCQCKNPSGKPSSLNKSATNTPFSFGKPKETENTTLFGQKLSENSKWECPTCMVENIHTASECVCCSRKNPKGQSKSTNSTLATFGTATNDTSKWQCPMCMVDNCEDVDECVCCKCENPRANKPSGNTFGSTTSFSFGKPRATENVVIFGQKQSESSKWECPTCMVENIETANECVCCSSKNPNSKAPFGSQSAKVEGPQSSQIKFGSQSNDNSGFSLGVTFGSAVSDKKVLEGNKSFLFGGNTADNKSTEGIKFGTNVIDNKGPEENRSYLFGTPTEKTNAPSAIKFGSSLNEKKDSEENKSFLFAAKSNNPLDGVRFGSVGAVAGNANSTHGDIIAMATREGGPRWRCAVCMVENAGDCDKCVCCTAAGPNVTSRVTVAAPVRMFGSPAFATGSAPMSNGGLFGVVKGDAAMMEFAFRTADSVPFESKIDIEADIEFAFSAAAVV